MSRPWRCLPPSWAHGSSLRPPLLVPPPPLLQRGLAGIRLAGATHRRCPCLPPAPPLPPHPLLQTLAEMRDSHYDPQTAKGEARGSRLSLHSAAKQTGSLE